MAARLGGSENGVSDIDTTKTKTVCSPLLDTLSSADNDSDEDEDQDGPGGARKAKRVTVQCQ